MQCPLCNYMMSDFDTQCPRCQGKGLAKPVAAPAPQATPPQAAPQQAAVAVAKPEPFNPGAMGCVSYLLGMVATFAFLIMGFMFGGILFGTQAFLFSALLQLLLAVWVYFDATNLGLKRGLYPGLFDSTPVMWSLGVFFFIILVLPGYLMVRTHHVQSREA